ncbi:MAG TPA: tetratricopeptide repeat protein, partial [Saprospiraceae bacterium]|nr:tetratricopeptide repeat protein [Saprospiraceae bacterium]
VIKSNTGNVDYAMYQQAMIKGLQDRQFDKIAILEEMLEKHKNSGIRPNALIELANAYSSIGQNEKAYEVYQNIIKEFPNETGLINTAYMKMGLISYNKGDLNTAVENYKNVLKNNPGAEKKQEALTALEEIYVNDLKEPDQYIEYIKYIPGGQVQGLYKDSLNFVTAKINFDQDSVDTAIKSFDEYLNKYDRGYYALDAHYYRAESYLRKKQFRKALKDYEYIINQGFNNFYESALYKAAVISFNRLKNYSKALKYYKKLEELTKDENKKYEVQLGAMRAAFRLNNFKEVRKYGNKILNNPLTTDKERSAAHYYIGKVAESNKVYDNALMHLNKVIRENRNSNWAAEARYLISKVYFERGEYSVATKLIKEANTKNTSYPYWVAKGLILLSDIFVKTGDLFNARAALEAVKENYTEDKSIIRQVEAKLKSLTELEKQNSRIEQDNPDQTIKMDSIK